MEHVALSAPLAVPAAPGQLPLALLRLLRPLHWAKNLLVIPIPLLETRTWTAAGLSRMGIMVGAFVLASSLAYVVNDIADRDKDRAHPTKRLRPIASGEVSVRTAWILAAVLAAGLLTIVAVLPLSLTWPLLVYVPLNLVYTFHLKDVALVDAFTVSFGFVLRILQGYVALGVAPSRWLVLAVLWSCLLLSLARRRSELRQVGASRRPALAGYSVGFIDQIATVSAGLAAASVMLYLSTEAPIAQYRSAGMMVLGPVTVFALFRYLQLVTVGEGGGSAVRTLLRDPPLVVAGGAWSATLLVLVLASA